MLQNFLWAKLQNFNLTLWNNEESSKLKQAKKLSVKIYVSFINIK